MSGRQRVKVNKLGEVVPYNDEKTGTALVAYGSAEDKNYDREKEIREWKKKKTKEGSRMIKIPTAQDLYFERDEMKKGREEIYEKILQNVVFDIKEANKDEKIDCQYRIPLEISHQPTYNFTECVWYVVERLRKEGNMFVRFFHPDVVYVNWKVKMVKNKNKKTMTAKKKTPVPPQSTKKKSNGRGGKKKEIQLGTFELGSDDDMLAALAGIGRR
jgi:hypothetical protein